jgi:hypothetical protein
MKIRYWLTLGLALLLVVPLVLSFPGNSQAQQNKPSLSHGPGMMGYGSGSYGNNDNSYRNSYRTQGYGYGTPGPRYYGNRGPRSGNWGNGNTWCPWNGGYAGSYRNSSGHCW